MEAPANLGPQIYPNTLQIGKEYYLFAPYKGHVKGTMKGIDDDFLPEMRPLYWILFQLQGEAHPTRFAVNPDEKLDTSYHKYYEIRNPVQVQAQTNVLRNLGVHGKLPMNIAMHELPKYLGLGGKSKRKTRRRKTRRRSK